MGSWFCGLSGAFHSVTPMAEFCDNIGYQRKHIILFLYSVRYQLKSKLMPSMALNWHCIASSLYLFFYNLDQVFEIGPD